MSKWIGKGRINKSVGKNVYKVKEKYYLVDKSLLDGGLFGI